MSSESCGTVTMSQFASLIKTATAETNTSDNWPVIIQICELASSSETSAKECVKELIKTLSSKNVNVLLYTLTIANSLVLNCGIHVKREIASRPFLDPIVKMLPTAHHALAARFLDLVQSWNEAFKDTPELGYMTTVYNSLKATHTFPDPHGKPEVPKRVVDDDDDLQLALALSLSENHAKTKQPEKVQQTQKPQQALFSVRALYDFPGSDHGELALHQGAIIQVFDDSTFKDWWKGKLNGKVGIFPSNYVQVISDAVLTDEATVDRFLQLLATVDPNKSISEQTDLQDSYQKVLQLKQKNLELKQETAAKLERMVAVNERFLKACDTYHSLMDAAMMNQQQRASFQPVPANYRPPFAAQQPRYDAPAQFQQPPVQPQYMPQTPY